MSNIIAYVEQNIQESKRLIGLEYEQLQQLIQAAQLLHEKQRAEIEKNKVRIIKRGGGRKAKLSISEQIILTLVYLHHLPTFQMLGLQFGVSESTANDIFHYWSELLRELLPPSLLEQVKKNANEHQWVQEALAEMELIVDSCEQPIQRPEEYEEQKKFYSGKKKNHTFKNQFIVTPNGREIVDIIVGKPGTTSDINIWRTNQSKFAFTQRYKGDKAYIGEPQIATPPKKRKHQELSAKEQEENREKASQRIFVEHVIRLVKIFRAAGERFRLRRENYQKVILTICGLVRLRIEALCLP
ncbi:transposase family protein [Trichocoleus sp. FACHB-40]|nr:transposase family protein [Trichocoleus sp. FACHB-40]